MSRRLALAGSSPRYRLRGGLLTACVIQGAPGAVRLARAGGPELLPDQVVGVPGGREPELVAGRLGRVGVRAHEAAGEVTVASPRRVV